MRSVTNLMDLTGRTALITGGAGHIGRASASALAELGASVILVDLPGAGLDAAVMEIEGYGAGACRGLSCDLADASAIQSLPSRLQSAHKHLDIMVNSAALVGTSTLEGWAVPFERQSADAWDKALTINLVAPFLLVQSFAGMLRASEHGSVINIASIYGVSAPDWSLYEGTEIANPAAYGASKAGLIQLTRWLSTLLAPDVRVNALTPGGILRGQAPGFVERYSRRTPLGRMGTEEDLKGAIAYLASDLSAYVTGQNMIVDGGWTA